jgi:hypothetical protein
MIDRILPRDTFALDADADGHENESERIVVLSPHASSMSYLPVRCDEASGVYGVELEHRMSLQLCQRSRSFPSSFSSTSIAGKGLHVRQSQPRWLYHSLLCHNITRQPTALSRRVCHSAGRIHPQIPSTKSSSALLSPRSSTASRPFLLPVYLQASSSFSLCHLPPASPSLAQPQGEDRMLGETN